ncbi:hypothetical protein ACP70R_043150 [Stipagrostis hirtigluma subsp. patula]
MAMAVQGSRQQGGGVKVKFIETQFVSSDAASFKAVVQRLTGKSPASPPRSAPPPPPAATVPPSRPRPCRPAFGGGGNAGWGAEHAAGHHHLVMPAKQEPYAAPPQRLEELHELCDFADLLYATAGATRDGFPY